MNKGIACVACAVMTLVCAANEYNIDPKYIMTPEKRAAVIAKRQMKRYGGVVRKAGTASGKVVFLNAQTAVSHEDFAPALNYIDGAVNPIWEVKDVVGVKVSNPAEDIKKAGGAVGVVLLDVDELPALLVAPEGGWAIVNVKPLKVGDDKLKLARRVRLELLRAFALVGGCAFMMRDPIALDGTVVTPEDLDRIKGEEYGADVRSALGMKLPSRGVTPWKVASYRQACKEGWAPEPTNEYQHAIWKKEHELPTNPIQIKYDPKKGK